MDKVNVPEGLQGYIRFFVPGDSTYRYEIVKFLEHELEQFKQEPFEDKKLDYKHPGVTVIVYTSVDAFRTLEPYLERDKAQAIAREYAQQFMQILKRENAKATSDEEDSSQQEPQ